jgi:hypothetical protein
MVRFRLLSSWNDESSPVASVAAGITQHFDQLPEFAERSVQRCRQLFRNRNIDLDFAGMTDVPLAMDRTLPMMTGSGNGSRAKNHRMPFATSNPSIEHNSDVRHAFPKAFMHSALLFWLRPPDADDEPGLNCIESSVLSEIGQLGKLCFDVLIDECFGERQLADFLQVTCFGRRGA